MPSNTLSLATAIAPSSIITSTRAYGMYQQEYRSSTKVSVYRPPFPMDHAPPSSGAHKTNCALCKAILMHNDDKHGEHGYACACTSTAAINTG